MTSVAAERQAGARKALVRRVVVGLMVVAGALAGCSGKYTYPNTLAKNLYIETTTDSSSVFSSVRAAMGVYRVDEHCRIEYQGTVDLDSSSISVGIPAGKPSYLVFEFASSNFLASSRRSITYETLLVPVAGRDYRLEVSYVDDIYNVHIRESQSGEIATRKIPRRDLHSCAHA